MNNELFNNLLIFSGLRKTYKGFSKNKNILSFIKRNITPSDKKRLKIVNDCSQPRNLARRMYKEKFHRDLSPIIKHIQTDDLNIEIPMIDGINEQGENLEIKRKIENVKRFEEIKEFIFIVLSWVYTLFIIFMLSFVQIYKTTYILKNGQSLGYQTTRTFFEFIYPVQYIFSVIYFGKDHYDKIIEKNQIPFNKFWFIVCIVKLCIYILFRSISLFDFIPSEDPEYTFPNYDKLSIGLKIPLTFFIIISWVYKSVTLFVTIFTFCFIFYRHVKEIKLFLKQLVNEKNEHCINQMTQDILEIRYQINISIDNFKNVFSSITIIGAISLGFLIENFKINNFNDFPWIYVSLYIIFEGSFLYLITKIDKYREDLINFIINGKFVKKYLGRYSQDENMSKFEQNDNLILINIVEENATTMDWLVLHRILSEGWSEFSVLGIPVNDGELIKRGIALVSIIISFNAIVNT